MLVQRVTVSALALLLAAGCAGSLTPPGTPAAVTAALRDSSAPSRKRAVAKLAIHIPKRVRVKRGRSVRYVSPSTQSASITIAPSNGCTSCSAGVSFDAALTPGSTNCATAASGTTCTYAFVLAPGSYTGSIATYDGPLANGTPTGAVLSLAQSFPYSILPGKANVPAISLYGVPANVQYQVLTNATIGTFGAGLAFLVAPAAMGRIAVFALDADGNPIVGPGSPTFTAAVPSGYTASGSGNVVTLLGPPTSGETLGTMTLTAHSPACSLAGAVCAFKTYVVPDTLVAIANAGNDTVTVYPHQAIAAGSGTPYAVISIGVSAPNAVHFDAAGNLWILNTQSDAITEYAPPYSSAPVGTYTANLNAPTAMALAPSGSPVAVANGASGTIEVFTPPNAAPATIMLSDPSTRASAIAFDPSGNLWVATASSNQVARYSQASNYSAIDEVLTSTNGISDPTTLYVDVAGNLYVAENNAGVVRVYPAPGYNSSTGLLVGSIGGITGDTSGHFLYVCSANGLQALDLLSLANDGDPTPMQPCVPSVDYLLNVAALVPSTNAVASIGYNPSGPVTFSRLFTSPLLSSPSAIDAWPH